MVRTASSPYRLPWYSLEGATSSEQTQPYTNKLGLVSGAWQEGFQLSFTVLARCPCIGHHLHTGGSAGGGCSVVVRAESDYATLVIALLLLEKTNLICLAEFGQIGCPFFFQPLQLIQLKREISLMEDHFHVQVCTWLRSIQLDLKGLILGNNPMFILDS